jgi:hypothetical protein
MKKIILILCILLVISFGCIDHSNEAKEIRDTIELKISELSNSSEILLLDNCKSEFETILQEPYPNIDDINSKYITCNNLVTPIITKTNDLIDYIASNQWKLSRTFDLELDNYINQVKNISINTSRIKTDMQIKLEKFNLNEIKKTCLKENTQLSCLNCCQNHFNTNELNYYNECKNECTIIG